MKKLLTAGLLTALTVSAMADPWGSAAQNAVSAPAPQKQTESALEGECRSLFYSNYKRNPWYIERSWTTSKWDEDGGWAWLMVRFESPLHGGISRMRIKCEHDSYHITSMGEG